MINNRQNGRRRGRGGGNQRQGGGGNPNMGNRIDSRARGNAAQLHEKYKTLARDAQMQGDRVNTEYYLQFADHYFRVLAEQRGRSDEQPQRRQREDSFDGDFDDYGDEGEPVRADEQNGRDPYREERGQRDDRSLRDDRGNRDEGNRDDGQREARGNRPSRDDRGPREDGQRDGGQRTAVQRDDRQRDANQRDDRPLRRGNRDQGRDVQDDQPRADSRDQGRDQNRDDDRVAPVSVTPANDYDTAAPAEPRRRGRPRKVRPEAGEEAATFDAAILPPSLGITTPPDEGDGEPTEKPRRRRTRAASDEVSQAS